MLSRIAESLFWLARYIERAEYTARILDVNFHTVLEQSKDKYRLHWDPLIVMVAVLWPERHRLDAMIRFDPMALLGVTTTPDRQATAHPLDR